jgi:hypothetical protein
MGADLVLSQAESTSSSDEAPLDGLDYKVATPAPIAKLNNNWLITERWSG